LANHPKHTMAALYVVFRAELRKQGYIEGKTLANI
jgi:hypothetical protein